MDCGDVSPLLQRRHVGALQIKIVFARINFYVRRMKKSCGCRFPVPRYSIF